MVAVSTHGLGASARACFRRMRAWCDAIRHCGVIADGDTDTPDSGLIVPPSHSPNPTLYDRSRYKKRPQRSRTMPAAQAAACEKRTKSQKRQEQVSFRLASPPPSLPCSSLLYAVRPKLSLLTALTRAAHGKLRLRQSRTPFSVFGPIADLPPASFPPFLSPSLFPSLPLSLLSSLRSGKLPEVHRLEKSRRKIQGPASTPRGGERALGRCQGLGRPDEEGLKRGDNPK